MAGHDLKTQAMPEIKRKMAYDKQVRCADKNSDCKRVHFQGLFAKRDNPPRDSQHKD